MKPLNFDMHISTIQCVAWVLLTVVICFLGDSFCSSESRSTGNTLQDLCSPPQVCFTHLQPFTTNCSTCLDYVELSLTATTRIQTFSTCTDRLNCCLFGCLFHSKTILEPSTLYGIVYNWELQNLISKQPDSSTVIGNLFYLISKAKFQTTQFVWILVVRHFNLFNSPRFDLLNGGIYLWKKAVMTWIVGNIHTYSKCPAVHLSCQGALSCWVWT